MKQGMVLALMLVAGALFWSGGDAFDRGWAALGRGDSLAAVAQFSAAIQDGELSRTNRARAYNNRGVAYEALGQHARAIADFDAATQVDPTDRVPHDNLVLVLDRQKASDIAAAPPPLALARETLTGLPTLPAMRAWVLGLVRLDLVGLDGFFDRTA